MADEKKQAGPGKKTSQYESMGVQADKGDIAALFDEATDNDFPGAFCKIIKSLDFPGYVECMHGDGVGSGSVTRYLTFLETGDPTILQNEVDCAVSMNTGDIAACGFVRMSIKLIDIIGVNAKTIDKKVLLEQIALGFIRIRKLYSAFGFRFVGGETADLVDQIRSYVFDVIVHSMLREEKVIRGNVESGDKIWGMRSDGQAIWETSLNSGGMSNGKTMGRTRLLHPMYQVKYPEICPPVRLYTGRFKIGDYIPELGMTIDQAMNAPTRQWAIIIKLLIEELEIQDALHLLHGISMNTGGGATKIGNLGKNIIYEKAMPRPSPYFQLIQAESGETWRNMFQSFNCVVGLDIVGSDEGGILGQAIKTVAAKVGIGWHELGLCTKKEGRLDGRNVVILRAEGVNGGESLEPYIIG